MTAAGVRFGCVLAKCRLRAERAVSPRPHGSQSCLGGRCLLGPFVDGDAILDGILRRSRSAWPAAFVTTREITPQLLGPLGCPIDEGVDRLATHGPQTTSVSSLQPAGNLLPGSTPRRGGRQRRFAGRDPVRSALHAACAIDRLRRREAASNVRSAAYCGRVRARSSISDGRSLARSRRSNGLKLWPSQSVLSRHPTNANSTAWQHSIRS